MKPLLILALIALLLAPPAYALMWRSMHEDWPTLKEAREAIGEAWRDTKEDLRR